jgi:hypothetical protein
MLKRFGLVNELRTSKNVRRVNMSINNKVNSIKINKVDINIPKHKFVNKDPLKHKSLCIFLQLHNDKITPEIINNVSLIYKYHEDFDVYITVIKEESISLINKLIERLKWKDNVVRIDVFGNRGMDIGAFLWQFERVDKNYGCVLKLHTKTIDNWRKHLINPFLKSDLVKYIKILNEDKSYGWIGAKHLLVSKESHESVMTRDMEISVFDRHSNVNERYFIGGSVFMIRFDILKEMVSNPSIKEYSRKCYEETPVGWVKHKLPHSFERFILFYSNMRGYKYLGIS